MTSLPLRTYRCRRVYGLLPQHQPAPPSFGHPPVGFHARVSAVHDHMVHSGQGSVKNGEGTVEERGKRRYDRVCLPARHGVGTGGAYTGAVGGGGGGGGQATTTTHDRLRRDVSFTRTTTVDGRRRRRRRRGREPLRRTRFYATLRIRPGVRVVRARTVHSRVSRPSLVHARTP